MEQPSSSTRAASKPVIGKPTPISASFGWANGKPVTYKDATKALQRAHALASDVLTARDDDFKALIARKRKTYEEQQPKKRQRQMKLVKDDSIGSTACSEITRSSVATDEEIEWSDCDERELSRNISILEQSLNNGCQSSPSKGQVPPRTTPARSPLKSPAKKRAKNSPAKMKTSQVSTNQHNKHPTIFHDEPSNGNGDDDDYDLEWSDCDEAELSRNISLLEQSMNTSLADDTLLQMRR